MDNKQVALMASAIVEAGSTATISGILRTAEAFREWLDGS